MRWPTRQASDSLLPSAGYNGTGNAHDVAYAVTAGRGASRVYVTGDSKGKTSGPDFATIAYNATTGARLWVQRYNGTGNDYDYPNAMAVSPGGFRLFVTGVSMGQSGQGENAFDYATIAYRA